MAFDADAANALFSALESHALSLGVFRRVNTHEPDNAPGTGLSCSITLASIAATPAASGLGTVSGTITFRVMIFSPMQQKPLDGIDPAVLAAVSTLLGEYSANFTLAGTVRDIDLLSLRADATYINQGDTEFRVEQITVPVVIDDLWGMSP
jgi:hypothetical protein